MRKKTCTLFLDRDGVLNTELYKDYVKTWSEFHFEPGVFEALNILKNFFDRMIIVTNQRGVGAGIMTLEDLDSIHNKMLQEFSSKEITIDRIYSAIDEDRSSIKRKPHPFMGQCAQKDFPDIQFENSWMAGNSGSDMEFAKSLNMKTVFIDDKKMFSSATEIPLADFEADSLLEFAIRLKSGEIQL